MIDRSSPAIERPTNTKASIGTRVVAEIKTFLGMAVYLWVVFVLFQLHQQIVLNQYHIPYRLTGLAIINALVLAKVMLIAEDLHLGERLKERPLIYAVLYKSIMFAVVFILAHVLEEVISGAIKGKTIAESIPRIGGGSPLGVLVVAAIIAICLLPFFAAREISLILGPGKLRRLIFSPRGAA